MAIFNIFMLYAFLTKNTLVRNEREREIDNNLIENTIRPLLWVEKIIYLQVLTNLLVI